MLEAIGVASLDELFEQIPGVRSTARTLPEALPEAALVRRMGSRRGTPTRRVRLSFLGMGIYDHYVPSIVDTFLSAASS